MADVNVYSMNMQQSVLLTKRESLVLPVTLFDLKIMTFHTAMVYMI